MQTFDILENSQIKIIHKKLCLNGPGHPKKGFDADNNSEFQKSYLKDLARQGGACIGWSQREWFWS